MYLCLPDHHSNMQCNDTISFQVVELCLPVGGLASGTEALHGINNLMYYLSPRSFGSEISLVMSSVWNLVGKPMRIHVLSYGARSFTIRRPCYMS